MIARYRIRAIDADVYHDEIVEMHRECFPDAAYSYGADGEDWWLALLDDIPVGFAHLKPSGVWKYTGYLARAGIISGHRGNGIQRRLIRVREARARRYGWQWLITDTITNPPSSNNLIACGFRLYEPLRPWGVPGSLYFRKYIGGNRKSAIPQ